MNYFHAIQLLENLETKKFHQSTKKFTYLVAMQRYYEMDEDERNNVEFLLKSYPTLKISVIESIAEADGSVSYFSCLIDGSCEVDVSCLYGFL
jgi:1,3-beta-glucan synthase